MYDVTDDYITAMRKKVRCDRVTGTLTLADGTEYVVNDGNLVSGSLKLERSLCGSEYRIGSFNLACLRFSFFIEDALGLDLTGASVSMSYWLKLADDSYEEVPLGIFYADPVLSVRRKNILGVTAYDAGVKADTELSDTLRSMTGTPAELIIAACEECGIDTDITADSLDDLPNSGITVTASDRQIQSCRDIIMWCVRLLCGYAVIDRDGRLDVIPARYAVSPDNNRIIVTDRTIREDERDSIVVTDTRAYIKYLTAYKGDHTVNYTSMYTPTDEQASPAAYVLERNPLLCDASADVQNASNRAWLAYIDSFKQRGVKAVTYGDPAIDTGDTVMFRGGDVDQRSGIIGIVTSYEWVYRGYQTIVCSAAECIGRTGSGGSAPSRCRPQSQKRIDSVSAPAGGSGVGEKLSPYSDTAERFNDYDAITFESGQPTGGSVSSAPYDHLEGYRNYDTGTGAVSGGYVVGTGANHISGQKNKITGGVGNTVSGTGNTVQGKNNIVGGGFNTVTDGSTNGTNIVGGYGNTLTNSEYSAVCGTGVTLSGCNGVIATGANGSISNSQRSLIASNYLNGTNVNESFVAGTSGGDYSISCSRCVVAGSQLQIYSSSNTLDIGESNIVSSAAHFGVIGSHNIVTNTGGYGGLCAGYQNVFAGTGHLGGVVLGAHGIIDSTHDYQLAVGCEQLNGNGFTVDPDGNVSAIGSLGSMGADYAEYFEWLDGNPEGEDRRGLLVALDGDKLVPASGNSFFGVVSAAPSVVGNDARLHWRGKYAADAFGTPVRGEDGKPVLSESYDPDIAYVPRSERKEWAAVGLVGRLIVRDDGSCSVGGCCTAENGIAKKQRGRSRARVLRRTDDRHVEVLLR